MPSSVLCFTAVSLSLKHVWAAEDDCNGQMLEDLKFVREGASIKLF